MNKPTRTQEMKRLNVEIPRDLHDAFKAAVAAEGRKINDVVTTFIRRYVEQRRPKSPRRGGAR
jgi:metal-responsive CopG/Arc/MetJ family transcriptional regulator